jgi:signal transduction histidine kinase
MTASSLHRQRMRRPEHLAVWLVAHRVVIAFLVVTPLAFVAAGFIARLPADQHHTMNWNLTGLLMLGGVWAVLFAAYSLGGRLAPWAPRLAVVAIAIYLGSFMPGPDQKILSVDLLVPGLLAAIMSEPRWIFVAAYTQLAILLHRAGWDLTTFYFGPVAFVEAFGIASFPALLAGTLMVLSHQAALASTEADVRLNIMRTLAHDMRGIVGNARSATGIWKRQLQRAQVEPALIQDGYTRVDTALATLLNAFEAELDRAQLAMRQLRLTRERTDLGRVARAAISAVTPRADDAQHTLVPSIQDGLLALVDAVRLQRCFSELILNAIKYSPAGSSIQVELAAADQQVIFRVADPGRGIHPADIPRLGQAGVRVGDVDAVDGSGTGLAFVKEIVEAHGGRLLIASPGLNPQPGQRVGAILSIVLPQEDVA